MFKLHVGDKFIITNIITNLFYKETGESCYIHVHIPLQGKQKYQG